MAELSFDSTGISLPTASDIREDVANFVKQIFAVANPDIEANTDPESPLGQLIDGFTAERMAKDSQIAFAASQYSLKQATGVYLDAISSLYFISRKLEAFTQVQCLLIGIAGTRIPFGALVGDSDGRRFRCLEVSAEISTDGTALVYFSATEPGPIEVQAGAVTRIITTVPGWDSVSNPQAGVLGRLRESDAELRDRTRQSVALNARGTATALYAALAQLDGVIGLAVLENYENVAKTLWGVSVPGHSVVCSIEGGDPAAIAEAIYKNKSGGCGTDGNTDVTYVYAEDGLSAPYTYKILRPTVTAFYVRVTFARAISEDEQDAVRAAIVADATGERSNARIGMAQRVYASRFYEAISSATDVPVASTRVRLGVSGEWSDSVTINADVQPSITAEQVIIEEETL